MTTEPKVIDGIVDHAITSLTLAPYRFRISEGDLDGLAKSIEQVGIIQPLTIRLAGERKNGKIKAPRLEVVCGARRLAAAKIAGLSTVPCIERDDLDDVAAEQLCLVENLERANIHPMSEAQSYERLIEQHGYSIEDLVAKFSNSERHVRGRLKLLALAPKVRKAYLDGKIPELAAIKIARLADHKAQAELLEVAESELGRDAQAERRVDLEVKRAMRDLASAPFDIARVDLVKAAGACSSCSKRTGTQRELFAELAKKDDYCLDATCYGKKLDAHLGEAAKAGDVVVLSKSAAAKEYSYGQLTYGSQYVETDEETKRFLGNWSSSSKKTLKQSLAKDPPKLHYLRTPDGEVLELYKRKDAAAKCKAAGLATKATASRARTLSPQETAANTRQRNEAKIARLTLDRSLETAAELVGSAGVEVFADLADLLCHGQPGTLAAKRRGFKNRELLRAELRKRLTSGDTGWLAGLAFELIIHDNCYGHLDAIARKALMRVGVNVRAIEDVAKSEVKAAAKKLAAKKKAAAKKLAAKKKTPAKKASSKAAAKNTAKKKTPKKSKKKTPAKATKRSNK